MNTIQHNHLTWIDIENPTKRDINFLKKQFNFHPLLLEEFTSPSQRPRAEEFENCLYVVMHIPLFDREKRTTISGEMDVVITRDHLITIHPHEHLPLKGIIKQFKTDAEFKNKAMSRSSGYLLYVLLENLLASCFPKLDHISENLEAIEREIFDGNEKSMVKEISIVKRDILSFRRTLKPQRGILESLTQKNYLLLEKELKNYFQDLIGTNIRVWNALENVQDVIDSLEETNNSLLSYKINEAMRFLTAISLVTFTLSVTVGIFSMAPFENFAVAKDPLTFWIILIFMGLLTCSFLVFFRKKRWL
jgi:magnesium transporter